MFFNDFLRFNVSLIISEENCIIIGGDIVEIVVDVILNYILLVQLLGQMSGNFVCVVVDQWYVGK